MHGITFCALLFVMIAEGLSAKIVDIEAPFLYGDLDEEIYTECPKGIEPEPKEGEILIFGQIHVWFGTKCQTISPKGSENFQKVQDIDKSRY